jgi:hypothetical protein
MKKNANRLVAAAAAIPQPNANERNGGSASIVGSWSRAGVQIPNQPVQNPTFADVV